MKQKILLVAFNGDIMCFVHVLLNVLDMKSRGYDAQILLEGSACKAAADLGKGGLNFSSLYEEVLLAGLIESACRACSAQMGVLEEMEKQGLELRGDMKGHPSLGRYKEEGYEILTF